MSRAETWVTQEVETLRAMAATHTAREIATKLERSTQDVHRYAKRYGVRLCHTRNRSEPVTPPTEHTEAELVGHSDVTPNPELTPDLYLKWRTTADEIHRILGAIRIDAITLPPNVYCFDSFKPERAEIAIADVANVYAGEGNTIAVSTFLGRTYRINAESGERAEEIRCTLVRLVQLYRRLQFQRVIYNLWGDEDTQWASIPPDSVRMKWPHTLPLSQYNPPLSSNKSA